MPRVPGRLAKLFQLASMLSPVTRAFLGAYVLLVPLSWALRYAPGETFVAVRSTEDLERPAVSFQVATPDAEHALVAVVGESDWRVLDWRRSGELTPTLDAITSRRVSLSGAPSQVVDHDGAIHVLTWQDGNVVHHFPADALPSTEPAPADALWLAPDGSVVGAAAVYARSQTAFGARPHYEPIWHIGGHVVTRVATERFVEADGKYEKKQVPADRDFLVFDAETGAAKARVPTEMRVDGVFGAPRYHGWLYSSGSSLYYADCDAAACRTQEVGLETDHTPIRAADYDPAADLVAVCTRSSILLYGGALTDETLVFLGQGALDDPCDEVLITGERSLLVSWVEGLYGIVRLEWSR